MQRKTVRLYDYICTMIFLIIIFLPLSNLLLGYYTAGEVSKLENRHLAPKPVFSLDKLSSFAAAYETWYSDHLLGRHLILRWHHLISYRFFAKTPIPQKVAIGKDGWLFITETERAVYNGAFMRSGEEIKKLVGELQNRTKKYAAMGVKFYVFFAPMKQEIYQEKLPVFYRRSPQGTLTDKIIAEIKKNPSINFIECKEELLEQKKTKRTYYKTDNHWNAVGGYAAYKAIIKRLSRDFPILQPLPPARIQFNTEIKNGGNLAIMMGIDFLIFEENFAPSIHQERAKKTARRNYPVPAGFAKASEYEMAYEQADTSLPTMVFIRDSYGEALIPYLKENFSRSLFIFDAWHYGVNKKIIEAEKPDIVVLEIFEPYIFNIVEIR